MSGGLLAAAINSVQLDSLKTPEGRDNVINQIFDEFLNYIPDYERIGRNEIQFKG